MESKFASEGEVSGVLSAEAKRTKPEIKKIKIDARRRKDMFYRQET